MKLKEEGVIIKKGLAALSIALGYPDTYYIGMSSLGYQSMYKAFNSDGRVVCERFFIDEKLSIPIRTLESKRKITDFNVIAFSISYELNVVNILKAIKLASLNIRADKRNKYDPIIIIGGAYASINPLPLLEFCDVICIGDGEILAPLIIDIMIESGDKEQAMEHFNELDGFLVSKYYKKKNKAIKPVFVNDDSFPVLISQILSNKTEFAYTYLVEIMRGCKWRCNFCWLGSFYKPCKIHSLTKILESLSNSNLNKKLPNIGLVAASSSDHPQFTSIVQAINKIGYKRVSFSSLRCSAIDNSYIDLIKKNNIKTITLAPETASKKLQKLINKVIDNYELIELCKQLALIGVKKLKLYFLIVFIFIFAFLL